MGLYTHCTRMYQDTNTLAPLPAVLQRKQGKFNHGDIHLTHRETVKEGEFNHRDIHLTKRESAKQGEFNHRDINLTQK
jgi:hypothetical protein